MRNDTDMLELERRLERLERSPNGGTLSQQENARLEREFNRLEGQIRDAEERVAQASRAPVWWVLAALVVGLALGAIVSAEMVRVMSGGSRARTLGSGSDAAGMALQTPADMAAPMESRVTDEAVVLRYRTKTGEQKVAIFPYALSGKPSVTYRLPPVQSARNYGKTESGSDSEPATPRRTAPRRGSD
ncbi:MAG: hypothetical protein KY468_14765 [Armatimonadetes bacterium]|nr:hypothetical protein [Armatimonadota bacterium]